MAENVHIKVLDREYNRFRIYVYTKDDPDYCFTQLQYSVNGQPWYTYTPDEPVWGVAPLFISDLNPYTTYTIQARVKWVGQSDFGGTYTVTARTLGNGTIATTYPVQPDASSPLMNIRIRLNTYASGLYYRLRIICGTPLNAYSAAVRINSTGNVEQYFQYQGGDRAAAISCFGSATKKDKCTLELETFTDQACNNKVDSSSIKYPVDLVLSEEYSKPSVNSFTFNDTVAAITNLTGSNQILLQSFSSLVLHLGRVSAQNGAYISKYEVKIGRVTKSVSVGSDSTVVSARDFTFGAVATYGDSTTITVTATDSRGFKTSKTATVKVIRYDRPKISRYIFNREDEVEETLQINMTGSVSSIQQSSTEMNSLQVAALSYKRVADNSWTDIPILSRLTISGLSFSYTDNELTDSQSAPVRFDENSAYDVRLVLRDQLGTLTETVVDLVISPSSGAVMILGRTTQYPFPRVGINQYKPTEALDVVGNIKLTGVIKTSTGQVMSYAGEVTDGSSFASYKSTGLYFYPYEVNVCVATSAPTTAAGFLEVYAATNGSVLQRFTAIGGSVYVRTYHSSSWSGWTSL